jgi:hypothetical protein
MVGLATIGYLIPDTQNFAWGYFLLVLTYATLLVLVISVIGLILQVPAVILNTLVDVVEVEDIFENRGPASGAVQLENALLSGAHLEGAQLEGANMVGATMDDSHLEAAALDMAKLAGADLRDAYLDASTSLFETSLYNRKLGPAAIGGIKWNNADISTIKWDEYPRIGDERDARLRIYGSLVAIVREYRALAKVLQEQGLHEAADRFVHLSLVWQRRVLLRNRRPFGYLGYLIMDAVSGHGYSPRRALISYATVIIGFAAAFAAIGSVNGHAFNPVEAIVFSVTSFHGRGFFPGGLGLDDPITILAAVEAVLGLFVEITFIATFTQRFFAR